MFSGSLRSNLDPFALYTDEELWNTLEHSHLKELVAKLPDQLEYAVAEGGENLRYGEKFQAITILSNKILTWISITYSTLFLIVLCFCYYLLLVKFLF